VTKKEIFLLDDYLPLARRFLEQTEPTHAAAPSTRETLLAASRIQRHAAGCSLSRRGQPMPELLVVLDGNLQVSMHGSDGRRSILWYLAAGQWVGLIAAIDSRGAVHDLHSHTESVLLHIPHDAFLRALQTDPTLTQSCLNLLCERSRVLYDMQAAESLLPLRARVARMLLMLADQHGRGKQSGIEIDLKLTQEEFADMLGVTRQSLNRELKTLEKQGLISIAYSCITLHDMAQLHGMTALTETAQSDNTRK
jgi:CRP-like cAMP-binding protein